MKFNSPPGWPPPPSGWVPPADWSPPAEWAAPPEGWQLWLPDDDTAEETPPAGHSPQLPDSEAALPPLGESAEPPVGAPSTPLHAPDQGDDRGALLARIAKLELQLAERAGTGAIELDDQRVLQDVGIYRYHHPLEKATAYKDRLAQLNSQIGDMVRARNAVLAADMFTFDGSLARGRRMVADLSRLMLRAYNAEADNCVRALRAGNLTTAAKRLTAAVTAIEKLGVIMEMRINPEYHALRVEELELTADFQMKRQEEKEKAREERERLREERRVEAEIAAEREQLEKERSHNLHALEQFLANGDEQAAEEVRARLAAIDNDIEANDYRSANIRAGYVYVISNLGAFGPGIVKIGMTRRLEPLDRVRELGDASVPFRYDVHLLHFSDDAVTLETELHHRFVERRVNVVNQRREFFFATPVEVREVLLEKMGGLLEYTEKPEALEYFQSISHWPVAAKPTLGPRHTAN